MQKYLAEKLSASLKVKSEEVTAAFDDAERTAAKQIDAEIAAVESRRAKWGTIQALYDVGRRPRRMF